MSGTSEDRGYDRDRVAYVLHGRPRFFGDPAVDQLFAIAMALLGEVCTLRERLDAHERLAAARGLFDPATVDGYVADEAAARSRGALREQAIGRVLAVLTEDVARLRAANRAADGGG
jgi:hypothetical protein